MHESIKKHEKTANGDVTTFQGEKKQIATIFYAP